MSRWSLRSDQFNPFSEDWWLDTIYGLFTSPKFWRIARHVIAWWITLGIAHHFWWNAWEVDGHVTCDFAGQWLMGRMFVDPAFSAKDLYLVQPQKKVFVYGYPAPKEHQSMTNDILRKGYYATSDVLRDQAWLPPTPSLMAWPMLFSPLEIVRLVESGKFHLSDPLIEGALYPPTAGLLFAPIMWLPPKAAHMTITLLYFIFLILNGYLISVITSRRIQWGEAALIMITFPNFFQAQLLGQNSMLTLTILVLGWWCLFHRRPFLAGLVWGLLAYKPVFAVSMMLVPILLPSLRMTMGYILSGGWFVLATLPWVGVTGLERLIPFRDKPAITFYNVHQTNPWERWLIVGKHAAMMYDYDRNWIWMSRDVTGLPRRDIWQRNSIKEHGHYLYQRYVKGVDIAGYGSDEVTLDDYVLDELQRINKGEGPGLIGKALLAGLAAAAVLALAIRRLWHGPENPSINPATTRRAALLLITGGLTCFHFMHYDLLIFVLPICLLLADWPNLRWPNRLFLLVILGFMALCNQDMMYPRGIVRLPFETFAMLLLWLWTCLAAAFEKPRQTMAMADGAVDIPGEIRAPSADRSHIRLIEPTRDASS